MRNQDMIERLQRNLGGPLPGLKAQLKMLPHPRPGHRPYAEVQDTCLKAGVMALVYPRNGSLHLALIRRPGTVLHHRDQIGFPGGQIEPGETFEQAALRETWEELGVPRERIRIIGALTPLFIPPSNYCIYPVVGLLDAPPEFIPETGEVAEILEPTLGHLLDPANIRVETWIYEDSPVTVPFFAFGSHKIWGATAMVLAEFLELIS